MKNYDFLCHRPEVGFLSASLIWIVSLSQSVSDASMLHKSRKGETSRNKRENPKVPRDKAMESSGSDCGASFLNDGKWVCWRATNRKLASFPPFAGLG